MPTGGFRSNIVFKFKNIPGLSFKCSLQKTQNEKTRFVTGIVQDDTVRPVRMGKFLTKDDVKPNKTTDIETMIAWNAPESFYKYLDEESGESKLLKISKELLAHIQFLSDEIYEILDEIQLSGIRSTSYNGKHYFLKVRREKRGSSYQLNPDDLKMYNLIYIGLLERKTGLLIRYTSYGRQAYAIMQADENGLFLSGLIHDTYQREREVKDVKSLSAEDITRSRKLFGKFETKPSLPVLIDEYEQRLNELIKKLKTGEHVESTMTKIEIKSSSMTDLLDAL